MVNAASPRSLRGGEGAAHVSGAGLARRCALWRLLFDVKIVGHRMGQRVINFYEFPGGEPDWVAFKKLFPANVSRFNVPFFEAGSAVEKEFEQFCASSGLVPHRKSIIEYDGKGAEEGNFIFLCPKDDKGACIDIEHQHEFIDATSACSGGGAFGVCGRGAQQTKTISVKPRGIDVVSELGMVSPRHPQVPQIYLVTSAVAAQLKNAQATGCELLPTNSPECFQLRISEGTRGPVRIGRARMGKRCPACGAAKMFLSDSERYFHPEDLQSIDFQICRSYHATNVGDFEIINGFPIISQRIFKLLRPICSFSFYSSDPRIRHAIVQIREA